MTTLDYLRDNWGSVYTFTVTADRDCVAQHRESRDTITAGGPGELLRKVRADYFRRKELRQESGSQPH